MTTSGNYRVTIDSGATYTARIRPMHDATPIDLSGAEVSFVVRDGRASWQEDLSDSVTLESDGLHVNLTPEQTSRFAANHRFFYAVDITFPNGLRRRYLQGGLYSRPIGVTR